jgi:heptosyltransferase-2
MGGLVKLSALKSIVKHSLPTLMLAGLSRLMPTRQVATPCTPRILVVRLDGIGDFVLMSGFLRELRNLFPQSRITLLVRERVRTLAETCPYIDELLVMPANVERRRYATYVQYFCAFCLHMGRLMRFAAKHYRGQIDLAIQPTWDADPEWANAMMFLSLAPRRIGYADSCSEMKKRWNWGQNILFTDILPPGPIEHEVNKNFSILRYLGGTPREPFIEAWVSPEHAAGPDFLADRGTNQNIPIIGFGLGAFQDRRRWPFYGELIENLKVQFPFQALLLGGVDDKSTIQPITDRDPSGIVMMGHSLPAVASALSKCAIFIGNNSGMIHLAAAVGLPVIEISCHPEGARPGLGSDPYRWGPCTEMSFVLRPPPRSDECRDGCIRLEPHCIKTISIDAVSNAVITAFNTFVNERQGDRTQPSARGREPGLSQRLKL